MSFDLFVLVYKHFREAGFEKRYRNGFPEYEDGVSKKQFKAEFKAYTLP